MILLSTFSTRIFFLHHIDILKMALAEARALFSVPLFLPLFFFAFSLCDQARRGATPSAPSRRKSSASPNITADSQSSITVTRKQLLKLSPCRPRSEHSSRCDTVSHNIPCVSALRNRNILGHRKQSIHSRLYTCLYTSLYTCLHTCLFARLQTCFTHVAQTACTRVPTHLLTSVGLKFWSKVCWPK